MRPPIVLSDNNFHTVKFWANLFCITQVAFHQKLGAKTKLSPFTTVASIVAALRPSIAYLRLAFCYGFAQRSPE